MCFAYDLKVNCPLPHTASFVTLCVCAREEQSSAQRPIGMLEILCHCLCPSRSLCVGDQIEADTNTRMFPLGLHLETEFQTFALHDIGQALGLRR